MNNRLHNITNPYQGKAKKVLCLCSAGLLRSPTTAIVLQREWGYNTRAAGLDIDHALIPVDYVMLSWADEIVVMEQRQRVQVEEMGARHGVAIARVIVLDVPDMYSYMHVDLQHLISVIYAESLERDTGVEDEDV